LVLFRYTALEIIWGVKGLSRFADDLRTAGRSGQASPRTRRLRGAHRRPARLLRGAHRRPARRLRGAHRRPARLLRACLAAAGLGLLAMAPVALVTARYSALLVLLLLLPMLAVVLACRGVLQADAGRARAEAATDAARALAAEQRRLVEVERALVRQLQENNRLEADLLATVAHELRTPLTAILGTLTTLAARDRHLTQADRDEFLGIAIRQGERLKRLIEQLLLASRLEEAADAVEVRPRVEAGELVRQTGRAVQLCYPDRDIDIAVQGSPLPVRAAPEAVSQVVINLLDNAAKYSPAGTPIWLEAGSAGGLVVIAVTDAGAGVPPGDRDRIFERFTQLDAGATRRAGGIGLGLWIARRLARAQGGELLVGEARAGTGARFELRLPRAEGATAPVERHARGYPWVGASSGIGSSPVAASR